ncbi:type II toxin-antitoxin system VapB family antitoxin [Calditrichota bacterium LG25]
MRTTINIPDEIMKELLSYSRTKSKTKAVSEALKEWIRMQKIKKLKSLRGKLKIEMDLEKQRAEDLKELP